MEVGLALKRFGDVLVWRVRRDRHAGDNRGRRPRAAAIDGDPGRGAAPHPQILLALQIAGLIAAVIYIVSNVAEFFSRIQTFVAILIAAIFFAYAIAPAVSRLSRIVSKPMSIAAVYVAMMLVLATSMIVILPSVGSSLEDVQRDFPAALAQYHRQASTIPIVTKLPVKLQNAVIEAPDRAAAAIMDAGGQAAAGALAIGVSAASFLAFLIVVPVLAIYLLLEIDTIRRTLLWLTPKAGRLYTGRLLREIDTMLGAFIRGQLTVAVIVGGLVTGLLLALHVKYALLIGVFAGLVDVVPYVGAVAGWLPAFAIAFLTNGWQNALLVTLGIVLINQLEGNVIVPRIISARVGLSPLTVIVALFVGSELLGVLGLLVAVPIVAAFRIVAERFVEEAAASPDMEAERLRIAERAQSETP